MRFLISFTDKSGNGQKVWLSFPFLAVTDGDWHYHCMNMFDLLWHDGYLQNSADRQYEFYVDAIMVARDEEKDIYIDDVFIWRDAVSGQYVDI